MNIISLLANSSSSGPPIGGILFLLFLLFLFLWFCEGVGKFIKWMADRHNGWEYEERRSGVLKKRK